MATTRADNSRALREGKHSEFCSQCGPRALYGRASLGVGVATAGAHALSPVWCCTRRTLRLSLSLSASLGSELRHATVGRPTAWLQAGRMQSSGRAAARTLTLARAGYGRRLDRRAERAGHC